jgi:Fe2+ transport system protein FeoA
MHNQQDVTTLLNMENGNKVRILGIEDHDRIGRLMLSYGLRVGSVIEILHQRKRGVVIGSGPTRIALGSDMARKLRVQNAL